MSNFEQRMRNLGLVSPIQVWPEPDNRHLDTIHL